MCKCMCTHKYSCKCIFTYHNHFFFIVRNIYYYHSVLVKYIDIKPFKYIKNTRNGLHRSAIQHLNIEAGYQ